ncbi:MAG: tetratricopeptide repeat protein [Syntrophaceae bacterium]|nr:tetratricopeptide repeat protein [Syntrophaceae bacterium]
MKVCRGLLLFILAALFLMNSCSKAPIVYSPLKNSWNLSQNDKLKKIKYSDELLKEDEKLYRKLAKHKIVLENAEDEEDGDDKEKPVEGNSVIEGRDDFDWLKTGYEAFDDKKWDEALNAFDKAIKINPQNMEAYFYRGNIYDELGDYKKAIVNYNRAIKLNPIYIDAYLYRGFAYNNLGQLKKAMADIKKAAKLGNHFAQKFLIKKGMEW